MTTDGVIRCISQKLRHYLEVQRREEGFVISGNNNHQKKMPSKSNKSLDFLHERSVCHLLKSRQAHKIIAYLDENPRLSAREKEIKCTLLKHIIDGDVSSCEIPKETARNENFKWKDVFRSTKPYELLGSVPRAEAERLITRATKLYVMTEMLISSKQNNSLEEGKNSTQETVKNCLQNNTEQPKPFYKEKSLEIKYQNHVQEKLEPDTCSLEPKVEIKFMERDTDSSVKESEMIVKPVKDSSCQTEILECDMESTEQIEVKYQDTVSNIPSIENTEKQTTNEIICTECEEQENEQKEEQQQHEKEDEVINNTDKQSSSSYLSDSSFCVDRNTEETSEKESPETSDIESGIHILSYNSNALKLYPNDDKQETVSKINYNQINISRFETSEDSNYCDDSYSEYDDENSESNDLSEISNKSYSTTKDMKKQVEFQNCINDLTITAQDDNFKHSENYNNQNENNSKNLIDTTEEIKKSRCTEGNIRESKCDQSMNENSSADNSSSDHCSTCCDCDIYSDCSCSECQENDVYARRGINKIENNDYECSTCSCSSCSADDEANESNDEENKDEISQQELNMEENNNQHLTSNILNEEIEENKINNEEQNMESNKETIKQEEEIKTENEEETIKQEEEIKTENEEKTENTDKFSIEESENNETDKYEEQTSEGGKLFMHPDMLRQPTIESCDSHILDEETQKLSIHDAAKDGDIQTVEMLVKISLKFMETVDERGWTPIHIAAANNHTEIIKFLALYGANVSALDPSGYTALHIASMKGHKNCIEALLEAEINVDCVTSDGFTPLHLASLNNHIECCKILLAWGASIDKEDALGRTVIDMVEEYSLKDVQALLENFLNQLENFSNIMDTMELFSDKKDSSAELRFFRVSRHRYLEDPSWIVMHY